jgi:predicted MFS family arabinose efflux permease
LAATGLRIGSAGFLGELRSLGRAQVLLAMAISVLASASLFSVFTYIVPMLQDVPGIAPGRVTIVLLLLGVGLTIGNLGNAIGAWVGGVAITHGLPYAQIPWIGVGLAAAGMGLAAVSHRLDRMPLLPEDPARAI